jgi:predicted nucleotidyltransferase
MDKKIIDKIKNDFKPASKKALGIVLYGSLVKGKSTNRSDIDICIVAPHENPMTLVKETLPLKYDVKIFETMPLFLQIQVIHHHKIIYAKDRYGLYEYFYGFRKLWDDQKQRQTITRKEALQMFS